jgi:formate-dependent nitrite reductase cytochrome c552 subunit
MKRRLLISSVVAGAVFLVIGGQWVLGGSGATEVVAGPVVSAANEEVSAKPEILGEVPPHRPAGYHPTVATGLTDYSGQAVGVACMTCHATKVPNLDAGRAGAGPAGFHQKMVYAHGAQSCLSCHNSQDYDALRLADGRKLAFADAQKLCQQCHGPQTRDYLHGSHGGMNGYWDKTKGPRLRNTCTDCHDPHAPAYPVWTPVFAPKDRGALQQKAREEQSNNSPEAPNHE